MKLQCQFEQELLDAIAARRWPDRAEAQLREHVARCGLCSDVAEIAGAFFEDRDCAQAEAVVPSASAVWWRAQIRAREEAARVAARPLLIFQVMATICVAIVAIALAPAASNWIRGSLTAFGAAECWRCRATSASRGCSAPPPTPRCRSSRSGSGWCSRRWWCIWRSMSESSGAGRSRGTGSQNGATEITKITEKTNQILFSVYFVSSVAPFLRSGTSDRPPLTSPA